MHRFFHMVRGEKGQMSHLYSPCSWQVVDYKYNSYHRESTVSCGYGLLLRKLTARCQEYASVIEASATYINMRINIRWLCCNGTC